MIQVSTEDEVVQDEKRFIMSVDAETGKVILADDITLREAKWCINELARYLKMMSDEVQRFNKIYMERK